MAIWGRSRVPLDDWYVICYQCGLKYYRSECKFTWDNKLMCQRCWSPKHPSLDFQVPKENLAVPTASPPPADIEKDRWETTPEDL